MNIDRIPPRQEVLTELFPRVGGTCSIDNYLAQLQSGAVLGFNYEAKALGDAKSKGFQQMLRLPNNNHSSLHDKYGDFYEAKDGYHNFINALAKRNKIQELERVFDQIYVFKNKDEAQVLNQLLKEARERGKLQFETIEGEAFQDVIALPKE